MKRVIDTLNCFINEVRQSSISKNIVKIIHYGSTTRGGYSKESDIDVLLVAIGDIKEVEEVCNNISYGLLLKAERRIEPMIYCIDDYLYPSYFIYRIKKTGREVFSMDKKELRKNESFDLLTLAKKFSKMAKDIYNSENLRGVVDLAYNSTELCAKALILLGGEEIPKTHNGIVNRFSQLFVKTSKVGIETGRMLNRGLDIRNKARYDAHATILEEDAMSILELSNIMIEFLGKELSKVY